MIEINPLSHIEYLVYEDVLTSLVNVPNCHLSFVLASGVQGDAVTATLPSLRQK